MEVYHWLKWKLVSRQDGSNFWVSLWMKSLSVTIQMKATEQYFAVVLFIMLCNVALTLSL